MYGRGFVWGMRVDPPTNANRRLPLVDCFYEEQQQESDDDDNDNNVVNETSSDSPTTPTSSEIEDRIKNKEYDLIIYSALFLFKEGRFHSSVSEYLPYLATVYEYYKNEWNKVVFVDGDDAPLQEKYWGSMLEEMVGESNNNNNSEESKTKTKKSFMFVRESQLLPKGYVDKLPPLFS
jgi:hypothetical protein